MSCPHTSSQNGKVERKHRHVTETGFALLFHSHVPPRHWVDAFSTTTYIINQLPMPVLSGFSHFEVLSGKPPNYAISIPLVAEYTHVYVITHLTNFLPVSSFATESTSHSVAVSSVPVSAMDLAHSAVPMDQIHATTSSAPSGSYPMITRAKSGIFKTRHPAHLNFV
ncbi:Retrovirus-related Pol polyprotein from transposon RE2 [Vitis vinifera]|uniref:Retrovirus-related Pol polyprotein from transposon RE2 n=1 Tax=Vitis vinifera TaxID=29760 RepID=A0A438HVK7_VITVI|nr:Retrovirus-related Pol polyprotein from transposon RE2 [Vitis vinifera]